MADTSRTTPSHATELALLVLLATLWGASYSLIKIGVAAIPPVTLMAARTVIAGLLLLAVLRLRGVSLPTDRALRRRLFLQAAVNYVVPFTLIAWAQQTVDAGIATILNSTTPVFAFLLTWAVFRQEAVSLRKLLGLVVGLAGIGLIVGPQALGGMGRELGSQLALLLATVSYAVAVIHGRHFKGLDPMIPAAVSLLCAATVLIPASLVLERPWTVDPSSASLLALAALAVFSTALAFVIYFRLIQTLGSVGTTAQSYLRVPVGVAIGVMFLGETLTPTAWAGFAAVVLAVVAMTLPARKAAERVEAV